MVAPSNVRIAGAADHQEIWRLLLAAFRENAQFTLAPEKVNTYVVRALCPESIPEWDMGPRGVFGVIGEVGSLEALAFVNTGCMWYSYDRHLEEYLVYVDPECRKSFHARSLISWLKDQSKQTNLPLMTGVISNVRTQAKVDLYKRSMPQVGAFFLYRPDGAVMPSSAAYAA